jgi:hypothetical protein
MASTIFWLHGLLSLEVFTNIIYVHDLEECVVCAMGGITTRNLCEHLLGIHISDGHRIGNKGGLRWSLLRWKKLCLQLAVFWDVVLCSLVAACGLKAPLKHHSISTRLHDAISQKTAIFIFVTIRIYRLISQVFLSHGENCTLVPCIDFYSKIIKLLSFFSNTLYTIKISILFSGCNNEWCTNILVEVPLVHNSWHWNFLCKLWEKT